MKKTFRLCAVVMIALLCAPSVFAAKAKKEKKSKGKSAEPYVISQGDGVIGYFTFDEDEVADNEVIDHSGNGANATTGALDGTELTAGKNGNGMVFNGSDEYLEIGDELLAGDGVTIAAWVNPAAWQDWARVFDIGDTMNDAWCGMDFNTKMLRMDVIGEKGNVEIYSPLPPAGKWTHIAATFGAGKAALYVNGKLTQKLDSKVTSADIAANVKGIYIGRSNWQDPLFNGVMDELLVANRVFSDAEIKSVYAGVVAPDAAPAAE